MKFNLIENAKESLSHAVEHLTKNGDFREEVTEKDYKHIIRDLSQAVELLLKEKLSLIDPALVFRNNNKKSLKNTHAVTTIEAIKRLANFGKLQFTEAEMKDIINCRNLRNRIEHHEFSIEIKEQRAIVGRLLSFIFHFAKNHLGLNWEEEFQKDNRLIDLLRVQEFWETHGGKLEEKLSRSELNHLSCNSCGLKTFDYLKHKCLMCGHVENKVYCETCKKMVHMSDTFKLMWVLTDDFERIYSTPKCLTCENSEQNENEWEEARSLGGELFPEEDG